MSSSSEALPESVRESAALFAPVLDASAVADPGGIAIDGVPVAAVLRPRTAAQVAACLGVAARDAIAVVPRGSGSKLAWGNVPRAKSLMVLDLCDLRQPLELLPEEGIATVGAGVRVAELESRCAAIGRRTLLDGLHGGATVGGTVASDPVGCEFAFDRRLRADLLGLEVALANGTLARCGGRVVKNVTGFDLVRLYCGSLGTLGVITEVTLRLRPRPEHCQVQARQLGDVAAALAAAQQLLSARIPHAGVAVDPAGRLLWRLEGSAAEIALYQQRFAGEAVGAQVWDEVRRLRAAAPPAGRAALRISARPSDVAAAAELVRACAGPGALVLALPGAGTVLAHTEPDALESCVEEAAQRDWLVCAEAAPLAFKESADVFGPSSELLHLSRALKLRFDPEGILAPGRFQGKL